MDNVTHTLLGAALAEAGLRRRTALATAALVIGANLPDVDGLLYWLGRSDEAYGFRRGWTHGVLAMAVWPFVLAGTLLAWDRWVRRRRRPEAPLPEPRALVALAAIGVLSHPLLDWLNTYGVRFLMPFSGQWYYGDTLFIADLWIWLALGLGWWLSRRRHRTGAGGPELPARLALAVAGVYVLGMWASGLAAQAAARRAVAATGAEVRRVMAGPTPLSPFRRDVVADVGAGYVVGTVDWLRRPVVRLEPRTIAKGDAAPEVAEALRIPAGAAFAGWARFPFFLVDRGRDSAVVHIVDARYARDADAGFGALTVTVPER